MKLHRRIERISHFAEAAYSQGAYNLSGQTENESHCRYVSSRGIKKSCGYWNKTGDGPTVNQLQQNVQSNTNELLTIYVKTERVERFVDQVLDKVDKQFVLVTGDCAVELDDRDIPQESRQRVLDHPLLEAWFAQNCHINHSKIYAMPIGLDYHTLTARLRHRPWGYFSAPIAQEKALDEARIQAPRLQDKEPAGYCNWHHVLHRGDRFQCIRNVHIEAMFLEEINIRRVASWQRNAGHFFTISPLGAATDCHRTWEALLLGSVPIVPRSAICSLFAELPVCIVDDWLEVTVDYLQEKRSWVLESEFDFGSLYLDWWKARIHGDSALPHRKQKFQDFIDTAHQPIAVRQLHAGSPGGSVE